jgi:hypothetical protein
LKKDHLLSRLGLFCFTIGCDTMDPFQQVVLIDIVFYLPSFLLIEFFTFVFVASEIVQLRNCHDKKFLLGTCYFDLCDFLTILMR